MIYYTYIYDLTVSNRNRNPTWMKHTIFLKNYQALYQCMIESRSCLNLEPTSEAGQISL